MQREFSILRADLVGPMELTPEQKKLYVEHLTRSFAVLHSDGTWEGLPGKTMMFYLNLLKESNTLNEADLLHREKLIKSILARRKEPAKL